MINEKDISFFEDLFSKTVAIAPSVTDLPHRSVGANNGRRYHRPMKGFIEPIGYLMAFLKAYNTKDKHSGKLFIEEQLKHTFAARYGSEISQISALKKDIDVYASSCTGYSRFFSKPFSHAAQQMTEVHDGMTTTHTVIKNFIRSVNAEGFGRMLFLGRDAWWFAVIAERMGIRYYYDSTISRGVSSAQTGYDTLIKNMGYLTNLRECVFVDTGFEGSIIKNLKKYDAGFEQVAVRMLSANRHTNEKGEIVQTYPFFVLSRNYALALEYYPKLNYTGKVEKVPLEKPFFEHSRWKVTQAKNNSLPEIFMWYALTVWYYFAETPNFVERNLVPKRINDYY